MASVKVLNRFVDIHNHSIYEVGSVVQMPEERVAEVMSVSPDLIQVIDEPKKRRRKEVKTDG